MNRGSKGDRGRGDGDGKGRARGGRVGGVRRAGGGGRVDFRFTGGRGGRYTSGRRSVCRLLKAACDLALTQREGRDGGGEGTEAISRPGEESRPAALPRC